MLVPICSRHVGKNGNFLLASLGLICYVLIKNNEGFCKVLNTFFKKKNSDFHLQSFEIIKVRDRTFRHFQRKWFEVILWATWAWRNLRSSHKGWEVLSGQAPAPPLLPSQMQPRAILLLDDLCVKLLWKTIFEEDSAGKKKKFW